MEQGYIARTSGIGAKDKIGYAMGDLASCLVFGLTQSVMNKFYTDGLGISVLSVMIMTIIARIWDAINDPIWGRLIDGAKPKADGRYRRWIKIFAVPVALSAVLMFIKIPGLNTGSYLAYAYVTYILFGMLYTCINIPYGSLAQVITSNDKERSALSVFRSIGSVFGALPAMVLASIMYSKTAEGNTVLSPTKVMIGAGVIALLSVVAYLLCYRWTKERVVSQPAPREKGQTMKVIKTLLKSRPFMAVSLASMLFLAAQMFGQGYNTYLFHNYFEKPGFTMLPTVFQYLPVAFVMFYASRAGSKIELKEILGYVVIETFIAVAAAFFLLTEKTIPLMLGVIFGSFAALFLINILLAFFVWKSDRRGLCSWGILLAAVFYIVLFVLALFGITNMWLYLAACLASGVGTAFIFLLIWALATDAIDYNKVKFGLNDEATSYAFYSFMRKLGQTVATILINVPLLRIGYEGSKLNTEKLTPEALQSMYNSSVMIPAVLFLLVFILLRFVYPLSKQKIDELQVEKERVLGGKKA